MIDGINCTGKYGFQFPLEMSEESITLLNKNKLLQKKVSSPHHPLDCDTRSSLKVIVSSACSRDGMENDLVCKRCLQLENKFWKQLSI